MIISPDYLEKMATNGRTRRGRKAAREELLRRERFLASTIGPAVGKRVSRVRLDRPWWMPGPRYRLLVRSIVVEERGG